MASFFVPIIVLFAAFFLVTSTNNSSDVSWWRIAVSGTLSGGAICGMHYLGNASIRNYRCYYYVANIVGAAAIAVTASTVALALFFVSRASWTNSWWKRVGCAIVLSSAVSGMHWCGAVGTRYQLIHLTTSTDLDSRNTIVIVVTILSVAVCLVIAGTAVYSARVRKAYADKAQKITLAAAVFDQQGRILVTTDGLLPSEEITSKFVQKTQNDVFSTAHPLFHWVFQASRNWTSVTVLLGKMRQHLAELPHQKRNLRTGVSLIDEDGHVIDNCDLVFRELFCLAAAGLADRLSENLTDAGILWDEILATGGPHDFVSIKSGSTRDTKAMTKSADDLAEKGINSFRISHGSLLCLVRLVDNPRIVSRLEASGFLFADPHQVAHIIGSKMQIRTAKLEEKLTNMKEYARGSMLDPGIHVGLFAVRTQVDLKGFDILVRRQARNLLPSVKMPLDRLEQANLDFLRRLDGLTVPMVLQQLQRVQEIPTRNASFAALFYDAVRDLGSRIDDPMFEVARLISSVAQVPCRPAIEGSWHTASMITFSVMIPIHERICTPDYQFIPLYFFKTQQLVYENSPHAAAFARSVHRELSPILNNVAGTPGGVYTRTLSAFLPSKLGSRLLRPSSDDRQTKISMLVSSSRECMALTPANMSVTSLPLSRAGESEPALSMRRSSTELKQVSTTYDRQRAPAPPPPPRPPLPTHSPRKGSQSKGLGFANMGIMISQEVTIDVDIEAQRNSAFISDTEDTPDLPHTVVVQPSHQGKGENLNPPRRKSIRALATSTPPMPSDELSTPKSKVRLTQEIELKAVNRLNIYGGEGYSTTRVEVKKEEAGEGPDTFVDELFAGCFRAHGGVGGKN